MRFARGSLAVVAPEWLLSFSEAGWVERYGHRSSRKTVCPNQRGIASLWPNALELTGRTS